MEQNSQLERCPNCKAPWESFSTTCKYCSYELKATQGNNALASLVSKFESIDDEARELGLDGGSRDSFIADQRSRAIRDFPVPNSREDLQELIYYIHPKIVDSVKLDPNRDDWKAKFSEVMSRAKNAYKNDANQLAKFQAIEDSLIVSVSDALQIKAKRNPLFVVLVIGVISLLLIGAFVTYSNRTDVKECEQKYVQSAKQEEERLEKLSSLAEQAIKGKIYNDATSSAAQLNWSLEAKCSLDENNKAKTRWQEKKNILMKQIESGIQSDKDAALKQENDKATKTRNTGIEKSW